jgi:ATP-dependent DNA helicase RecG
MINFLSSKISTALSINPSHTKALERLSIDTVRDLIFYSPRSYKTKILNPDLNNYSGTGTIIIRGTLQTELQRLQKRIVTKLKTNTHLIELVFFGKVHPFLKAKLKVGQNYIVEGEITAHNQNLQIVQPEFIFSSSEIVLIEPLYNLTYGINNKRLHQYIRKGLDLIKNLIQVQNLTAQEPHLWNLHKNLVAIHQPIDQNSYIEEAKIALQNLAAEELIAHQIFLSQVKQKLKSYTYKKNATLQDQVLTNLGFRLTQSQLAALESIEQNQCHQTQMIRLLQGDVGSGKTAIALLSMLNVIPQGQAALMVPTELLAVQHYKYFQKALFGTTISCCILTGSLSQKEKNLALKKIQNGTSIIIGTHALFQEKVQFSNLRYIVIDEQHRFGVKQRLALIEKAEVPDLLLMTATPIPRSLAMILLGNISVSQMIKSQHNAKITTLVMPDVKEQEIYKAIQKTISKGEKVYWICPFIENNEDLDIGVSNVENRFEKIKMYFEEHQVAMMHGETPMLSRETIMEEFAHGQKSILVATTIVEVGVDVPNATLIVIENAERFGLAQLHQLRGRVGRSNLDSYCILLYSSLYLSKTAKQRLEFMRSCNDGFLIAEEDLKLRGAGDVLGVKQSGSEDFYFVDKAQLTEEYYSKVLQDAKNITPNSPSWNFYTNIISKKNVAESLPHM